MQLGSDRLIALCQELIRIPSLSGQEETVARHIRQRMLEIGFDEVIIDKYGSVVGRIAGSKPGKAVLLDGHIDTVPVSDRDQWVVDPFGAEIKDGSIYGRGTSDMKGSVAARGSRYNSSFSVQQSNPPSERAASVFCRLCVSCTLWLCSDASIFGINPLSVLPGPTSMNRSIPSSAIAAIVCFHSTGDCTCIASVFATCSPYGCAVRLA